LAPKTISPFVQMAALHLHDAAGFRNRGSIRQQQNGTSSFSQPRRNAWPPQERLKFSPLLGRHGNDPSPLVLCHRNILVSREPDWASLVSE
jgi:hypothetical protein